MSKLGLIPRRTGEFVAHTTENPNHKAPIPLFPEPDSADTNAAPIKVKLRRNPILANSEIYEKFYTPWTGHTVEVYCKFRVMLKEFIKNAPLTQPNEQVTVIYLLLNGIPLINWQNVIADAQPYNEWTQESLDKALHAFRIKNCGSNARQEQKRFMKRRLGLQSNYLTATLFNCIEQLNCFLPFLPGNGLKFESDDIRFTKLCHPMHKTSCQLPTTSGRTQKNLIVRSVLILTVCLS
jgi:hypothetical protein